MCDTMLSGNMAFFTVKGILSFSFLCLVLVVYIAVDRCKTDSSITAILWLLLTLVSGISAAYRQYHKRRGEHTGLELDSHTIVTPPASCDTIVNMYTDKLQDENEQDETFHPEQVNEYYGGEQRNASPSVSHTDGEQRNLSAHERENIQTESLVPGVAVMLPTSSGCDLELTMRRIACALSMAVTLCGGVFFVGHGLHFDIRVSKDVPMWVSFSRILSLVVFLCVPALAYWLVEIAYLWDRWTCVWKKNRTKLPSSEIELASVTVDDSNGSDETSSVPNEKVKECSAWVFGRRHYRLQLVCLTFAVFLAIFTGGRREGQPGRIVMGFLTRQTVECVLFIRQELGLVDGLLAPAAESKVHQNRYMASVFEIGMFFLVMLIVEVMLDVALNTGSYLQKHLFGACVGGLVAVAGTKVFEQKGQAEDGAEHNEKEVYSLECSLLESLLARLRIRTCIERSFLWGGLATSWWQDKTPLAWTMTGVMRVVSVPMCVLMAQLVFCTAFTRPASAVMTLSPAVKAFPEEVTTAFFAQLQNTFILSLLTAAIITPACSLIMVVISLPMKHMLKSVKGESMPEEVHAAVVDCNDLYLEMKCMNDTIAPIRKVEVMYEYPMTVTGLVQNAHDRKPAHRKAVGFRKRMMWAVQTFALLAIVTLMCQLCLQCSNDLLAHMGVPSWNKDVAEQDGRLETLTVQEACGRVMAVAAMATGVSPLDGLDRFAGETWCLAFLVGDVSAIKRVGQEMHDRYVHAVNEHVDNADEISALMWCRAVTFCACAAMISGVKIPLFVIYVTGMWQKCKVFTPFQKQWTIIVALVANFITAALLNAFA